MKEIFLSVVLLLAFASWVSAIGAAFLMVVNRKPEVNLWDAKLLYNPFNIIFLSNSLSAKGIFWRRVLGICVGVFSGMIVLAVFVKFYL